MARQTLAATASALVAGSITPLLFIGTEAIIQGDTIEAEDFGFGFTLVAPLLLLISESFPWKGGLVGCATLLIWAAVYHFGTGILTRRHSIRSNPSG